MQNKGKKLKITVPLPPSVNHCYVNNRRTGGKGRALTEAGKNWKLLAYYAALGEVRAAHWECVPRKGQKVILELIAHWPDERRHDMNNLHKLLCDAWEGLMYEDDCRVLVRDMDFDLDRKAPRLDCVVYMKE